MQRIIIVGLLVLICGRSTFAEAQDSDPRRLARANAAIFQAVSTACGNCIVGIGIGDPADAKTWRLDWASNATNAQKDKAMATLKAFDYMKAMNATGNQQ